MRLCGHDCLVSGRYDPGSASSGRYFYRLDPQDPLNFGRNFLSLSYTLASGQRPPCRLRNWHTHCSWRYTGTEKKRIGNARVRPIVFLTTSVRDHLTHWHKGGRQGAGLGFTLVSTKRGSRNDTVPTLPGSDSHRLALTVICYTLNRSPTTTNVHSCLVTAEPEPR
jgi:hypothetical protein